MTTKPDVISALHEALTLFRSRIARPSTDTIMVLLCLCERDGLSAKELAFRCGMSSCRLSRSLKFLQAPAGRPLDAGLVWTYEQEDDRRCIVIRLTEQGRELRDRLMTVGGRNTSYSPRQHAVPPHLRPPKHDEGFILQPGE